jgi:virulence-associated protein VagC
VRLLRLPPSMWFYGAVGAVLIIWSGARLILLPARRDG